ncbi:high affinity copper uptake protein 1-like [Saccostrea cucullata]|uniref:high affinity copper uptake protein 1-like n=1 Tax=Saccostrea cuccullata TaxID=36930 RepID=UPI002ED260EB
MRFFSVGVNVPILFKEWNLNTKTGLFLTCIGSILLGILYQIVKCLRQYAHRRYRVKDRGTIKSREHGLQTILYCIQMINSYILMLIIMTFNVWAFICTIAGLGLGYFLCGWAYPIIEEKIGSCSVECNNDKPHRHGNEDTEQELKLLPSPSAAQCEDCSL